ncbi:MAG: hypothetical protein D6744_17225, partial [Planctomycetota bacterium]
REWYASCGGEAISQESVSDESLRVLEALGYAGGEVDDDSEPPAASDAPESPSGADQPTSAPPCPVGG